MSAFAVAIGGKADMILLRCERLLLTVDLTGRRNTFSRNGKMGCTAMHQGHFRGFRRGTRISLYLQAYLNKVERRLNERPKRQDLKPHQGFNSGVASTG